MISWNICRDKFYRTPRTWLYFSLRINNTGGSKQSKWIVWKINMIQLQLKENGEFNLILVRDITFLHVYVIVKVFKVIESLFAAIFFIMGNQIRELHERKSEFWISLRTYLRKSIYIMNLLTIHFNKRHHYRDLAYIAIRRIVHKIEVGDFPTSWRTVTRFVQ